MQNGDDGDEDDNSIPLSGQRRLKSLDEFERPWWYPTFVLPEGKHPGVSTTLVAIAGVLVGVLIGLLVS